jgi:hypothetical protein
VASEDRFRHYVEAGAVLAQFTRDRAEALVRELTATGPRQDAAERDEVVARGAAVGEQLVALVRAEVGRALGTVGFTSIEDLAHRVAAILREEARPTDPPPAPGEGSGAAQGAPGVTAPSSGAPRPRAAKAAPKAKPATPRKAAGTAKRSRGGGGSQNGSAT